jgi:hypothetical protein
MSDRKEEINSLLSKLKFQTSTRLSISDVTTIVRHFMEKKTKRKTTGVGPINRGSGYGFDGYSVTFEQVDINEL